MPRLFPPEFYEDSEPLLPNFLRNRQTSRQNLPDPNSQNLRFQKQDLSDQNEQNLDSQNFQVQSLQKPIFQILDNSQVLVSQNNFQNASNSRSFHDLVSVSNYKNQNKNVETNSNTLNLDLKNFADFKNSKQNLGKNLNFNQNSEQNSEFSFQNSESNSQFQNQQNQSNEISQNSNENSKIEKQNGKYLFNSSSNFNYKGNKRNSNVNNFTNFHRNSNGNSGSGIQEDQNFLGQWKIFLVVFLAISLVSLGVLSFYSSSNSTNLNRFTVQKLESQSSNSDLNNSLKIVKPKNLSSRMLFLGNTFWGRYIDDWSKASDLKEKYPFSGLSTLEKNKYDAWISGLECPITTTYRSSSLQDYDLKFSCLPEYTKEAAKWFEAFTLANNHTDNMEEVDGFVQTKKFLGENGIQSFGYFDSENVIELCKVVSFSARSDLEKNETETENSNQNSNQNETGKDNLKLETENLEKENLVSQNTNQTNLINSENSKQQKLENQNQNPNLKQENNSKNNQQLFTKYQIPVALCGYHNVFKLPTDSQLAQITEYSKYLPTIVMPHGGAEYTTKADQIKTSLYRQMIELGADAVIGDHPHSVQNTEVWQEKLIVYSLGNFLFDQQAIPLVRQSLAIDGEILLEFDENLEKWTKLAQICKNQNLGKNSENSENKTEENSQNNFEKLNYSQNSSIKKLENSENEIEKKSTSSATNSIINSDKNSNNFISKENNTSNFKINSANQKNQNCLEIAKSQNLQKPKFSFIWSALATDSTGKLTQKANPQITQNVLAIANWTETKKELEKMGRKTENAK